MRFTRLFKGALERFEPWRERLHHTNDIANDSCNELLRVVAPLPFPLELQQQQKDGQSDRGTVVVGTRHKILQRQRQV
jgi:hypothetical protein